MSSPMAPDKSLAAEIEAKEPGQVAYEARFEGCPLGPRGVSDAWRDLPPMTKAIWARVEDRVSAAIQSRAFEDGARKKLSEALAAYDAAERDLATAEAVHEQMSARADATAGIGEIMDAVGAEEACMRCLNAEAAAQARLIEAVRAALHPTPTTEDKGREDRA